MGIGGISIWQLVIILVIVILLFGTKKLKNIGTDLGGAVKGFKDSVSNDKESEDADPEDEKQLNQEKQSTEETVYGKNKGRSNETSDHDQAILELKRKIQKKKEEGYL